MNPNFQTLLFLIGNHALQLISTSAFSFPTPNGFGSTKFPTQSSFGNSYNPDFTNTQQPPLQPQQQQYQQQQQQNQYTTSTLTPLPTAEADRAFRYATSLEAGGQPRSAHAAYHEAATLFQCFLDSTEFAHVTDVRDDSVDAASSMGDANTNEHVALREYLTYSCLRLAFLSHDALSDAKAALRLYKEAAVLDTTNPSAEAYDGIGTSIEACLGDLGDAVEAYETALRILEKDDEERVAYPYGIDDNAGFVKFHLSVALERLGRVEEAEEIMEGLRRSESKYACLVDSWGYIRWHTRRIETKELNLYLGTRDMLRIGLDAASDMLQDQKGLVCEFGVAKGRSMRTMQELLPLETPLHGFDTFTGLPQSWNSLPAGAFSTNGDIPNIEGEVYFHRGLFRDSIPAFLGSLHGEYQPLAFANIDALLYGSTLDILESMHSRVVPGTIFVFADYCCHPTWRQDEFRAWRECCKRFGWTYEYLGFSLATKQVVVRVTGA
eukprot:scaffold991_cov279-Chaetoceros_neogracile.AAC.12